MTTEQKIQYIADHYGYEPQIRQLIEELSELIQAVCKHNRAFGGKQLSESRECPEKDAIIKERRLSWKPTIFQISKITMASMLNYQMELPVMQYGTKKSNAT